MGRDKALIEIGGVPLAVRVAAALRDAGATDVRAVGGDADALSQLGLHVVADRWPGEGPLGGILTALSALQSARIVLVAACDLVDPTPATIAATVRALDAQPGAAVAAPILEDRRRWDQAAWRATALAPLTDQFNAGERAIHRAVGAAGLTLADVGDIAPSSLRDADTPADLPPA
jgi:molybdopterin-guanine dinucleotide biosynthesis protein A